MASEPSDALQFSIPLPRSPHTLVYIRLSTQAKAIVLSLTTAAQDDVAGAKAMGSFVYALPDRFNAQQPLATTLFSNEATLEFTTRLSKLIARRTGLPVYVTNSMSFADTGMGDAVDEEVEAFKSVVEVVLDKLREAGVGPAKA